MWRWPAIFALTIVAFALAAPPQQAQQQAQRKQQQAASGKPPPPPKLASTQQGQQPGGCTGSSKPGVSCAAISAEADYRQAIAADEQVSLNWFQAVVGLFTVVAAGFAAKFAKDAADAARGNLEHDKKSFRAELRPWISFNGFDVIRFQQGFIDDVAVPYGLVARVNFINIGRTPAMKTTVLTTSVVRPADEWDAPEFPIIDPGPRGTGVVGPNRPISGIQRGIGPEDTDAIMAHRARLWLHARAEYQEAGHQGPDYVTEVTIRVSYDGDEITPEGLVKPRFNATTLGPLNSMS